MRWRDKAAIATGAASGIGTGTSSAFAEEVASLVLVDRDTSGLATVRDGLVAKGSKSSSARGT